MQTAGTGAARPSGAGSDPPQTRLAALVWAPPTGDDCCMPGKLTFEAKLVATRSLTPHIKELEFERLDGRPSEHRPGQWVTMVLPPKDEDGRIDRAYSLVSMADGTPRFKVMVTRVDQGLGSTWLHAARPGETVPMRGPSGTFVRDPLAPRPVLFVTAGTGFCPVRPMFQEALLQGVREPLWLLMGARTEEEIPYREDLAAWARHQNVRVEVTLSQPPADWKGRRGHVQQHLPEVWGQFHAQHADALVYVAGWKRMVWPVGDLLRKLQVDRTHVRIEVFDPVD
jgi:ferredoxin-NADP reductase